MACQITISVLALISVKMGESAPQRSAKSLNPAWFNITAFDNRNLLS
jgi:hypothetical protein